MALPVETIANHKIKFAHIKVGDILDLIKIPSNMYEKQLSVVLQTCTSKSEDEILLMPVQVRYAIFLRYLQVIDYNSLDVNIRVSDFLSEAIETFKYDAELDEETGISIQHLCGAGAEALEQGCEDDVDWILGEMAVCISVPFIKGLEPIDASKSIQFTSNIIAHRIEILKQLTDVEFEKIRSVYVRLRENQMSLINYTFYKGIVLNPLNGGADDAPVRFRADTVLFGRGKTLYNIGSNSK